MEAWRRQLNDPVSAFPIAKAGPAHIATLKTFDPPLDALEGRRFRGAERRGKRLLFPTDDGELVLLVHLMTAGRLKFLQAGEKGPKTPAFALEFQGGSKLVLTENARKKRAGVWLLTPEAAEAELAHLGPEALGLGAGAARRDRPRRVAAAACAAPRPARDRGHRPRVGERDPPRGEALAVRALERPRRRGGRRGSQPRSTPSSRAASSCARRAPPTRRPTASTGASASRATSAARRSRRSTSRSTRSSTARTARPAAASSRTGGFRACSASDSLDAVAKTVADLMVKDVLTVEPSDTIGEAAEKMMRRERRRRRRGRGHGADRRHRHGARPPPRRRAAGPRRRGARAAVDDRRPVTIEPETTDRGSGEDHVRRATSATCPS